MTLEDFFTLSELKDGLTDPSRVQELVSVMQKEKDHVVKNVGDATRQWAAVASTIAATENKGCLDLFIQLDGLWFINRWLMDTQKVALDANNIFIEESIIAMLRAVEQLHLDSQKSVSSGIHETTSNLLDHHSSRVQNKARVLFDSWKEGRNGDAESCDIAEVNNASSKIVREEGQSSSVTEVGNDDAIASGLAGSEKSLLRSPDNSLPERIVSVQIKSYGNASLECEESKQRSPNYLGVLLSSVQEVGSVHEGLSSCALGENTLVETCNLHVPKQGIFEGKPDVVHPSDFIKGEQPEQNVNGPPEKLDAVEIYLVSTKLEPEHVSMDASETKAPKTSEEPILKHNVENGELGVCYGIVTSVDMRTPVSDRKSGDDHIIAVSRASENNDDNNSNVLLDSSVSKSELEKTESTSNGFDSNVVAVKEGKGHVSSEGESTSNGYDSNKPGKCFRSPNIVDKKGSTDEFDNGIVDTIEITRQITLEIDREVYSSSFEKIAEGVIRQPCSPYSVEREDEPTLVPPKEVSSGESHSTGVCSDEEQRASISSNIEVKPECRPNMQSMHVTKAAQDSEGSSEKRLCMFDLNEDGYDDMDISVNAMSAPLPIVYASKPAPNPGLPKAPLQFEGTLGWKGLTATSAFCPASPHSTERNLFGDGNSDISKQRKDWLDFDLNVAEGDEGYAKPIDESSCLPSGQLSMEFSPKRSSRLKLDLNSISDDCDAQPSYQRMEEQVFLGRNGYWSPSPASSTTLMQPSVRNIDLNDRPSLHNDLVDQGPSKSSYFINAFGRSKSDAPVISILGARVEVGRREYVPQTLFLPIGKASEPAIDLTMTRAGRILGMPPTVSYNHSSVFGYNGVASASIPPLSFSSAMSGSGGMIPYMVDSRGAPVVPRFVAGSSSIVLPSYSQPPYIMNMPGTQLALNGVGPSRPPNLDQNTSFMIEGGGNREALTARQFLFPGHGTMPQPSSSGVSGKRKEPDGGWESYPSNYNHPQPPWK
ncbi:unnamed protein product [Lupinus luteus]|uniref:TFIIS N-terminal domain-containing protein n=1 Tax=Lupinus luteus TaxID=3873 RepID=A0AAV1W930_LUPLU